MRIQRQSPSTKLTSISLLAVADFSTFILQVTFITAKKNANIPPFQMSVGWKKKVQLTLFLIPVFGIYIICFHSFLIQLSAPSLNEDIPYHTSCQLHLHVFLLSQLLTIHNRACNHKRIFHGMSRGCSPKLKAIKWCLHYYDSVNVIPCQAAKLYSKNRLLFLWV